MFLDSNVLFSFTCSYAVYFCIKCGTAVESELYLPEFRCYFKCLVGGQPADFSCFPNAPQIKTPDFWTTSRRILMFFLSDECESYRVPWWVQFVYLPYFPAYKPRLI